MEQNRSKNGSAAKRNTKHDEQLRKRLQMLFENGPGEGVATVNPKTKKPSTKYTKTATKEKFPQRKVTVRQNPPEQVLNTKKAPQNNQHPNITTKKKHKTTSNKNQARANSSDYSHQLTDVSQKPKNLLRKTPKKAAKTTKKTGQKHTLNGVKRNSIGKAKSTWKEGELEIPSKKSKLETTPQKSHEHDLHSKSNLIGENVHWEYCHKYDSDSNFSESECSFSQFHEDDTMNDLAESDFDGTDSEEFCISDEDFDGFNWAEEDDDDSSFDEDDIEYITSGSDDDDYHLPEHVPEDLIIHKGTATQRKLEASDCVQFEEECEDGQIIEIEAKESVKIIKQPEQYERAALEELNKKEISIKPQQLMPKNEVETSCEMDCPQLVPIAVDYSRKENGSVQILSDNGDSFESCSYEECSEDDCSIISVDVNSKYLKYSDEEETSTDDAKDVSYKRHTTMSAEIIEAENCEDFEETGKNAICIDENDDAKIPDLLPSELLVPVLNGDCEESAVVLTKNVSNLRDDTKTHKISTTAKVSEIQLTKECQKDDAVKQFEQEVVTNTSNNVDLKSLSNTKETSPSETQSDNNSIQQNATSATAYRSIFCNCIDSNYVLVLLLEPIYIYGTVRILPMIGTVEVYGYTPRIGEEFELFSPHGLCSVYIAPKRNGQSTPDMISKELRNLGAYFSTDDLTKVRNNFCPEAALILLQRNDRRKNLIDTFKKYMNENIFPNMKALQIERRHYSSESRLGCVINMFDDVEKTFKLNPQWNQLKLQQHSKVLIIGGKSVGKSTMLRYLVNRSLAQHSGVLLIDLDIGQPELFLPLTISASVVKQPMIGPGFFLNHQPVKAFAIGHSNVVLCTHRYMLAVKELLSILNSTAKYAQMPWLVNTMGYNKGFGAELTAVICEFLQPTDVVQLQSNKHINNFDVLMEPHVVAEIPRNIYADEVYRGHRTDALANIIPYKLHVFNSAVLQESSYQRDWVMKAKDLRYAITLARLSDALDTDAEWLTQSKPLSTPLDKLKVLSLLSGEYTREQLLKSIPGNLVYLCRMHNENIVECFGIGIVRAVDYQVNQVYLLPAFRCTRMTEIDCLAIGEIPMPTSMLSTQGLKVAKGAPYMFNTVDDNATKSIKQIYYRPAEFLSGKHRNMV